METIIFGQLAISLALGLLAGLQRQHAENAVFAGVRTFPLVTLLGTLITVLDQLSKAGGLLVAAALLGLSAVVLVAQYTRARETTPPDAGMTTTVALLLMFVVGSAVVAGPVIVGVAVGVAAAVLLQFKPELHRLSTRLGNEDLRAIMTFALMTCVVLPVVPNRVFKQLPYPLSILNPFETWLIVVLMVGISLGGYLAYKFLGRNAGVLLAGLLGGAISSTATTLSYARRSAANSESVSLANLVILLASSVVYVRVLVEIAVAAPDYFPQLAPPVALMLLAGLLPVGWLWFWTVRGEDPMPSQKNPTELKSALLFGGLYAVMLMGLTVARQHLHEPGLYAVALLSGLTDMDAITLSTARLVQKGPADAGLHARDGWRIIVLAAMSNLVFKTLLVALSGHRKLAWRVACWFALPLLVGALLCWAWPQ